MAMPNSKLSAVGLLGSRVIGKVFTAPEISVG